MLLEIFVDGRDEWIINKTKFSFSLLKFHANNGTNNFSKASNYPNICKAESIVETFTYNGQINQVNQLLS